MGKRMIVFLCCLLFVTVMVSAAPNASINGSAIKANLSGSVSSLGSQAVILPESFQLPARILFGIPAGSSVSILHLSIILVFFVFCLLMFMEFLEMTSFSKIVSFMIGLGLTILLGVMGLFHAIATGLASFFSGLGLWGTVLLILGTLVALFILKKVVRKLRYQRRKQKAQQRGQRFRQQEERIKTFADNVKKVDEKLAE